MNGFNDFIKIVKKYAEAYEDLEKIQRKYVLFPKKVIGRQVLLVKLLCLNI
jgi:hypothetical protein